MPSTSNFLLQELPPVAPSDTSLIASIQLTALDGGHFIVPNGTRYVALEIGCSDRETMDELWLPKHADGFLVSFEPALDKYAVLLARGTEREHKRTRDRSVRLGAHHARGLVLPLAVTPSGGNAQFNVQRVAGCNSVLPMSRKAWWAPWCSKSLETRTVPSISLRTAIGAAPSRTFSHTPTHPASAAPHLTFAPPPPTQSWCRHTCRSDS
jgi:hypothetical protein